MPEKHPEFDFNQQYVDIEEISNPPKMLIGNELLFSWYAQQIAKNEKYPERVLKDFMRLLCDNYNHLYSTVPENERESLDHLKNIAVKQALEELDKAINEFQQNLKYLYMGRSDAEDAIERKHIAPFVSHARDKMNECYKLDEAGLLSENEKALLEQRTSLIANIEGEII